MRRLTVLFTLTPMLLACVTTGKYEALEKQLSATTRAMQGRVDEKEARIVELDQQLAAEQARTAALTSRMERLEKSMAAKISALEASKATLIGEKGALEGAHAQLLKDRSRLKASVQDMQRALSELESRRAKAEARIREFRSLIDRFKPLIDTGRLRVKMVDGRMVVELATDVLFASGSAKLSKEGREALAEVSTVLSSMNGRRFQIEGHTDNVPINTRAFPSNWNLAALRAITVTQTMIEAGMPGERVSAASFGEYKPASDNDSKEGRSANRRIEIVLVPDLTSLPGFEELNDLGAGRG